MAGVAQLVEQRTCNAKVGSSILLAGTSSNTAIPWRFFGMSDLESRLRLDKWLWAARFFKTRHLAATAIGAGKVRLNAQQVKPAKEVRPGDTLEINCGELHWTVVVEKINDQRRPAVEARLLYAETPDSMAKRQRIVELNKLAPAPGANLRGRPTKKAGRQIRRFSFPS